MYVCMYEFDILPNVVLICYVLLNLSTVLYIRQVERDKALDPSNRDPCFCQPASVWGSALRHSTATFFLNSNIVYIALLAKNSKKEICSL
jgi:hypothetical protein